MVLPHHALRAAAARRHGAAGGGLARARPRHAAPLDRPLGGHGDRVRRRGRSAPVRVFSSRPDTLYGATFLVVAPGTPLAEELCGGER
ncbi:MAG: hypothetical protein ACRDQ0_08450, partial [Pseudonocardia sp.]